VGGDVVFGDLDECLGVRTLVGGSELPGVWQGFSHAHEYVDRVVQVDVGEHAEVLVFHAREGVLGVGQLFVSGAHDDGSQVGEHGVVPHDQVDDCLGLVERLVVYSDFLHALIIVEDPDLHLLLHEGHDLGEHLAEFHALHAGFVSVFLEEEFL